MNTKDVISTGVSIIIFPRYQLLFIPRSFCSSVFWWSVMSTWRKAGDQWRMNVCTDSYSWIVCLLTQFFIEPSWAKQRTNKMKNYSIFLEVVLWLQHKCAKGECTTELYTLQWYWLKRVPLERYHKLC